MFPVEKKCDWGSVTALMNQAVNERIFPSAVLLVWKNREILYHKAFGLADIGERIVTAVPSMIFDLASLTKPLATTLAVIRLVSQGLLGLDACLPEIFGDREKIPSDKQKITVRHLLAHASGFPAYRPYYKKLSHVDEDNRWKELWKALMNETLQAEPGKETCYSDLGFLVLQKITETVSKKSLRELVRESFYDPLGLNTMMFSPGQVNEELPAGYHFVATEVCAWRKKRVCGEVHDENAYVLGGVAGHAGLFGEARDICKLLVFLYDNYLGSSKGSGMQPGIVRSFWKSQRNIGSGTRALGFDMPAGQNSSSGRYFSRASIGHLGFTGTSFWFDPEKELLVILLTNRVYWGRENEKIKTFRPLIHDRIVECLDLN